MAFAEGELLGSYRIISALGAGGMGTVYLAEVAGDTPGTRVALKVVHPHLLKTPGFFKRFLREAELGKKVTHRNVVRTFDADALVVNDDQVNFMVMEYVEGRSLRELLNDLGTVPETLIREIALQTAAGLAAIHDAGIVHRDLKPENILITDAHEVRIMDLGVAKLQEASVALTQEGHFAGSFLYAAPEQFGGVDVGPAVDLYSLGVILYELGTGHNPFHHEDTGAIIHAHMAQSPAPVTDHNPDLSLFFSELVHKLLAKRPADRFESAETVHALFQEGERSRWWGERELKLQAQVSRLPKILLRRETDLHGRDPELDLLAETWERVKQSHGHALLLEGEAGIGKTRLADAFLRSLQGEDAHVLYGAYPPSGGLGGLSDAVIGRFGYQGLEEALAPYLTVTPSLIPAFAALVRQEAPPTGVEPLRGHAIHAVTVHLMHALAAEKPTVWVVDDLHFAPRESRQGILALARAAAAHRVLLLLTARPGLPEDELAHFSRLEIFHRIALGRLGAREVIELLRDALRSEALAQKLGGTIAYKSDGVPFFVFELLRSLKEGALLKQTPDGTYVQTQPITDIRAPSAIKDLIDGRLRELTKEEHRAGIVRAAGRAYRFDQNQIHEIVLGALSDALKEEYHALLAEAFRARGGIESEADGERAHFLAWHHLHGNEPEKGLPFLRPALNYLERSYLNDAVIALADRALAQEDLVTRADRIDLLCRKADRVGFVGQTPEALRILDEALHLAVKLGDRALQAEVHMAAAVHYHNTARFDALLVAAQAALDNAVAAGDRKNEVGAANALAACLSNLGRYEEAQEQFERGLALARELKYTKVEALLTINLGVLCEFRGRFAQAQTTLRRATSLAAKTGRQSTLAAAKHNVASVTAKLGLIEDALRENDETLALHRRIGDRHGEGNDLSLRAGAHEAAGDLEAAERFARESLAIRREIGDTGPAAATLVNLARLRLDRGRKKEAVPILEEALEMARGANARSAVVHALGHLASLDPRYVDPCREALEEHGPHMQLADRLEAHFLLWKATRDPAQLQEARELLRYLIDNAPEECRETMVTNNPVYRELSR
ncbi:MAG: serine/threonine-protein kinase [Planctomycetota bacterium]|jgi:tetratricopeptide (TPR) repeat protein/predicted Ser/Thr protein kinase